jgi:hypothetical protein
MTETNEVANALAVRCLFTASHVRTFLVNDQEVADNLRQDLIVAADLLETVCTEIEHGRYAY